MDDSETGHSVFRKTFKRLILCLENLFILMLKMQTTKKIKLNRRQSQEKAVTTNNKKERHLLRRDHS